MRIDYVLKLGGSLLYDYDKTKELLKCLYKNNNNNIVITVGSGYLGELYKEHFSKIPELNISFNDSLRNYSNIQSLNASILNLLNTNFIVCETVNEIYKVLSNNKIPIIDARGFQFCFKDDIYQKSDVRATNICNYLNCDNLLILTDVNGIYNTDPKKNSDAFKIDIITTDELRKMDKSSLDEGAVDRIEEYSLKCCVLGIESFINNNGIINEELLNQGTIIKKKEKVYEKKI